MSREERESQSPSCRRQLISLGPVSKSTSRSLVECSVPVPARTQFFPFKKLRLMKGMTGQVKRHSKHSEGGGASEAGIVELGLGG